ncbi:hypothetical protein TrLO_g3132 [Triparma laevis f. longispina]|uniref:Phosphatidylinositol N-acetylglucosaminyltransferase n=1 Tax=Triparma laevis f. longispina TaxID=1714387 RepID=A0A9W7C3Y3_9STRA|nr:hypothetical protein TrLO_g3132 [Triparma laevis f. longispina]
MPPKRRHSILMVSDFFLPRVGGVETHIRSLSSKLAENHKVTILTSSSNSSHGLLPLGPLKIYYLPLLPLSSGTSLPTFFSSYIFFKTVIIREGITLVHGHQATSVLANECLFYASLLNIPTCSTDHSLFPLNDLATLHLSAAQRLVARADMHIGVSEVTCANVVLRNKIDPNKVKTIPNAVDGLVFKPLIKSEKGNKYDRIKIVVLSRLCYRKGTDILIKVIPEIIRTNPHVDFLIGGDGNKSLPLLEMIENRNLESRVTMFGSVSRDNVPSFLQRGDIFLNTSLTESFCIAILEAACCGLVVVSTDVGGVREVLRGCKVEREGGVVYGGVGEMVEAVKEGVERHKAMVRDGVRENRKLEWWKELSKKYTWTKIAGQVEKVYDEVSENKTPLSLWEMMEVWCTNRSYIEACVAVAFSLMVLLGMRAIDLFRNERTVEVDTERDRLYDNGGGNNSRGRARSKSRGGAEGRRRGSRGRPTN